MRGLIITVIGLMVMLLVGIIVVQALITSQATAAAGWGASAQAAWASLQANIWTAFTLMVIIPIIIGAVAILAYLKFGGT